MMVQAKNFNFAANYINNSSFDIFVHIIRLYILSCQLKCPRKLKLPETETLASIAEKMLNVKL